MLDSQGVSRASAVSNILLLRRSAGARQPQCDQLDFSGLALRDADALVNCFMLDATAIDTA
jgi:hypothetical protein